MTKPAFMLYRLLRNNKESGPFTKSQLEEMGLKPYDLLWIEGKGGAWRYASEIDDLKSIAPVVEEQPYDRFYKSKEKQDGVSKQNNEKPTVTVVSDAPPVKSAKPRFRISGDKIVMIDNTVLEQPQPIEAVVSSVQKKETARNPVTSKQDSVKSAETVGPDWEEMYSEWKGEEKDSEPAVAAKTQTFEEIKQRYEESKQVQISNKHSKKASAAKQNIMAAVAVVVLAIGGYAGYRLNQTDSNTPAEQKTPVEQAAIIQDEANKQQNTADEPSSSLADPASQAPPDNVVKTPVPEKPDNLPVGSEQKPAKQSPTDEKNKKDAISPDNTKQPGADAKKPANNNSLTGGATNKKDTQSEVTPIVKKAEIPPAGTDKKADINTNDVKKANTAAPLQIPAASENTTVKQVAPKKRISDYVSINKVGSTAGSNGVQNVQLSVKNVTDFPIDLAVVDIQYYSANGHYLKGETMYVKNIGSGDNVNVRVPDNRTARSINYKVSLVSSEQKTLYLVGD